MIGVVTNFGTRTQPMTRPIRIMIAERQAKVRFAVRVALERHRGPKTIGEASDAEDMIIQARAVCPDLAILAWELPGSSTAELIGALRQECPNARVIVLGSRAEMRAPALESGANAFVWMGDAPDELMCAIDRCLEKN